MSLGTLGKIGMADKLSVAQLQQAVKSGSIPAYIGIPLIQEKVKEEQEAKAAMAAQNTPQNSVAEQVMAQATQQEMSGLGDLPTNLPEQYAAGGIIGYDEGGDVTQEEYDEALEDAEFAKYAQAMINRTPNVEKGLRSAPTAMSYSQVQGQAPRNARAMDVPTSSHKYADTVLKYAEQYGVDPKLALHVLNKETGGMKNPETAKSKAGALGIMQIMPATAKDLGIKDPLDPEQSAEGGVRYLSNLRKMVGDDPRLIAAAYNAGPGNVRKHGGVPPFAETRKYVEGLAEGGIASIKRYAGTDGSLVEDTEDPDYVMYNGIRTKRSLLDQSKASPWNSDRGMAYPSATEGLGTDLTNGTIKSLAAAGDIIRLPFYGIDKMLGTKYMDQTPTPFYDKYVRQAGLDPEPAAPAATSTQTIGPGNAGTARRDQIAAENEIAAANPNAYKPQTGSYDKSSGTFTAPKESAKPAEGEAKTTEKPSPWQELRDMVADSKKRREEQKQQDMWLAIMSGGLGALAGQSQYANVNIGQGALHGMQQYGTARREAGKEEAADLKTLANIARYEGMDKYYTDQAEARALGAKGALDQKEYVAANNVMKNLWEARMDEAKYMYGDPKLWDDETRKKAMAFVNQVKADPKYIDAERRIGQLQGFSVVGQRPAA